MPKNASEHPQTFSKEWRREPPTGQLNTEPSEPNTEIPKRSHSTRRASRINWPLWLGGLIVLFVTLVAIAGPSLAPRDPMEENTIIQVGERWEIPPFPTFTVPDFPLGSDQFGRDLLSRLLWGIRPTLVMVTIVAAVRLGLGIAIGLCAGWFTGQVGRGLDAVIGAALSVPVLIVALGAIAAIGVELGLLAFIIGLSINGWVDTARLVREQTQLVKGDLFIEAARALGASDSHILLRHVVRQIMPMVWMLFAFEISSTLVATAGLGFLGYYIGGEVWVDVDDFVARRLSGMPELGQMLATSWSEQQAITEPWGMIIAGSTIFFAVLGFNFLGEGLRMRLSLDQVQHRSALSTMIARVEAWAEEKGWLAVPNRQKLRPALVGALALLVGGGLFWWRAHGAEQISSPLAEAPIMSAHPWAAERHDPQGTLWSPVTGPVTPVIQWIWEDATGFSGGPAVSADGILYLASNSGILYAVDPDGQVRWRASLPAGGVGTPALDTQGHIFVTDQAGGLSALTPEGELLWRFQPENASKAQTGPIVASDGTIFYPTGGNLHAVSAEGQASWTARAPYGYTTAPPHLDPAEALIFFRDAAFNVKDGSSRDLQALSGKLRNEQYITGADGGTYYRSEHKMIQWRLDPSDIAANAPQNIQVIQSFNKQIPGIPKDAGVTREGIVWGLFSTGFNSPESGVVWLDANDQVLGNVEYLQAQSRVIAVGAGATVYSCGTAADDRSACLAVAPGSQEPLWQVNLEPGTKIVGGALVSGRLYVALAEGLLYALGPGD